MSAKETNYGISHLDGQTDVERLTNPTLRGSIRRADPDGSHSQPFVSGLNGTSLTIAVTPVGNQVANFVSDDWQAVIDLINGLSPANLAADDVDGFLQLRNLNGGEDNSIEIVSGSAAALLGFVLSPEPGSIAYAGEIATAPAGTYGGEANPQGTALVAGDEDLRSGAVNRGLMATLLRLARVDKELDVEVPVVRELDVTISVGIGANPFIHITDSSIRIPVTALGIAVTNPNVELFSIAAVTLPNGETIHDLSNTPEPMTRIDGVFSHDGTATALDDTVSFAAWGTPDGKSLFGPTVPNKDKQSSTAITAIRGNVIQADAATFQTNGVQPGDTLEIASATNTTPFSHNGEFVVVRVLDETRVQVRAKSEFEAFVGGSTTRPTELNDQGIGLGNVRVPVGNFVSAEFGVSFRLAGLPGNVTNGTNAKLRVLSGVRLKDLSPGDVGLSLWPSPSGLTEIVRQHVATGDVAAGASTLRHAAAHIDFAGGGAWADTTTNPAATVEAQLDKILTDLAGAGNDGAAKLRALLSGNLAAGTVRDQLNQLATEWFRLAGANVTTGNNSFNGQTTLANVISAIFTGLAKYQSDSVSRVTPLVEHADSDASVRSFVDANGLPGGYYFRETHFWAPPTDAVTNNPSNFSVVPGADGKNRWAVNGDTSSSVSITDADNSGLSVPAVSLSLGITTNQRIHFSYTEESVAGEPYDWNFEPGNDAILVLEWSALSFDVSDFAGHNVYMGTHGGVLLAGTEDFNDPSSRRYINFRLEDGDTNWQAAAGDPLSVLETSVDTGVAPADGVAQYFRLELHGAASPRGVANSNEGVAVFFINGVEVATITTNVRPSGETFVTRIDTDGLSPATTAQILIGPLISTFAPHVGGTLST